jgi:hypothetical protein
VSELERAYECVTAAYGPVHPDVQKVTTELVEVCLYVPLCMSDAYIDTNGNALE